MFSEPTLYCESFPASGFDMIVCKKITLSILHRLRPLFQPIHFSMYTYGRRELMSVINIAQIAVNILTSTISLYTIMIGEI